MLLMLILRNYSRYKYWKRKKRGEEVVDYSQDEFGGLLSLSEVFRATITPKLYVPSKKGGVMVYELVTYDLGDFNTPVKSYWSLLEYLGEKPIKDCNFEEFIAIYCSNKPKIKHDHIKAAYIDYGPQDEFKNSVIFTTEEFLKR